MLGGRSAHAQRTGENVVRAAQDAFGTSIGSERIGLYSSGEVRGFSPIDAGNVRIEGFSFDQQGTLSSRLVESSTVHVGLTAQGYPFPAPTGIVDYRLRKAGDDLVVSLLGGSSDYGGAFAELDAKIPIVPKKLSLGAGLSYAHEEYYDGSDARVASFAIVPRWRPSEVVEIVPFWSYAASRDEEVAPHIITAGPFLPPQVPRRRYYGQPWADLDTNITNLGVLARARLGAQVEVAGAAFRSVREVPKDHAELFTDTQPDGRTRELVIADPPQRRASTGGELTATWTAGDGPRLHRVRARVLGRVRDGWIGGSSPPVDLGGRQVGEPVSVSPPTFQPGRRTHDEVRQWTGGIAYEALWKSVGELVAGIQRTDYRKAVEVPDAPRVSTRATPLLLNGAVAAHATEWLAFYAGYTRGLEESGIAPGNAVNRNEVLPAIVTRQIDAGVRSAPTDQVRLVAGVFDVRKPNFTLDERNVFTQLGEARNQGIELSLTGRLFDRLTLVTGAVLSRPRVEGPDVAAGRVGPKPVGQTSRLVRANLDYVVPWFESLSFDLGVLHAGERVASRDNLLAAPALTTVDVGARLRFSILGSPATLRLQAKNITNAYGWRVMGSNTFRTNNPRAFVATLAIDY